MAKTDDEVRVTRGDRSLVFDAIFPSEIEIFEGKTSIQKLVPKVDFRRACFNGDASAVFVGAKNIVAFDVATGKKSKLACKGHKAPANDLVVDDSGDHLYSAGGSYIYTDDRFVRAFDAKTGAPLWKVGGKKAGFHCVAVVDDLVLAAAENGRVYAIKEGEVVSEVVIGAGATLKAADSHIWIGVRIDALTSTSVTWRDAVGKSARFTCALSFTKGALKAGEPKRA
ncbi:MAG TPA: PQQ-binding-like beta-propeller repeat protein [Myxococcota bacterium]|jgi:outer membrane protein assembly factor BamB